MSDYHVRYGYLKLVKFPNDIGAVPTFKEEKMKLTKDETELVLKTLKKYRKEKLDSKIIKSDLIGYLNSIQPEQLLLEMSNGIKPTKSELETIKELLDMGLPVGVVNVLIQFIMLDSGMRLHKQKAKKFGLYWVRNNIITVEQAIEFVNKKKHRTY